MSALVRIAWRNLWRSPRRTSLTIAASVFAIVLTLWSLALEKGSDTLAFVSSFRAMQKGFAAGALRYAVIAARRNPAP